MEVHVTHSNRISTTLTNQGAEAQVFNIYAATDDSWVFAIKNDAGTAVAIHTWGMRMNLYNDRSRGTLLKSWTTSSAGVNVSTDGSNGNATLTIDDSDLAGANNRDYDHAVLEIVGYTGGSITGEPNRRVQIPASVRKSLYTP
jgi:hypothetical protein